MIRKILTLLILINLQSVHSQFFTGDADKKKHEGYFDFYYEDKTGKVWLVVEELDSEFLYVHALSQGLGSNDIGLDRGQLGDGVVVKFVKMGHRLLLVQPNLQYRALTDNELERRSIEEAFAKSVLFGFEIEEQEGNSYLIEITDFLVRDAHGVSRRLKSNGQGNYSLDKTRSAINISRTKAFPKNVEFDALLTFVGKAEANEIKSVSPDHSSVTSYQHHSFVELPDDQYEPRAFDPRSGSYPMTYMDYSTEIDEPIVKRFIYRHRLKKKDPSAEKSEPVEPIVYYLDPGTPEPVRSALLEGASWWDQAFEAAGYLNAFQVKILPDGADPLDLRYNVIQWVHRSTRGWSYGGSIHDPRTGEIIKGHVSLGSLRIRQDFMIAQALKAAYAGASDTDSFALEMALARIRQLSAHEVGHTLGFSHNFAASTNNRASVMDYPHPWIRAVDGKLNFEEAYASGIGSWDKVTVRYSYGEYPKDEDQALASILDQAFDQGHRYITDADARPMGSSHAFAHLWDNGNDIVEELNNVMEVRDIAIDNFSVANIPRRQPYTVLEDVFVPLYFYHRYQTEAVAKMIGGTDYTYAVRGGGQSVSSTLSASKQREALKAMLETVSAERLAIPEDKLGLFPARAFGYDRSRESFKSSLGVDFDPYGAASTASHMTFSLLLHPERASRLVAQKALDKKQLGLDEVVLELIENSFGTDHKNGYLNEVQNHINIQLVEALFDLASSKDAYTGAKAVASRSLKDLAEELDSGSVSGSQKDLDQYLASRIRAFLKNPEKRKPQKAPGIPDGSPIGITDFQ